MSNFVLIEREESQLMVRKAGDADLDDIASLLDCLGYPLTAQDLSGMFHRVLCDPEFRIFLACLDHQTLGLITLRLFPSLRLNGYEASIEEMVVYPSYRGRGIGSALLACALDHAEAKNVVRVEVHTSHKRESFQRKFYEKHGFIAAQSTLYRMDLPGESRP